MVYPLTTEGHLGKFSGWDYLWAELPCEIELIMKWDSLKRAYTEAWDHINSASFLVWLKHMVTMLNIYEAESWSPGDFCVFVCVFFQNLSFILKLHIVISTTAFMAGRTWEHLKHHISSSAYFSKVTSKKGKSATLSQFQWWVLSIDPFFLPLSQEELRIGKIR